MLKRLLILVLLVIPPAGIAAPAPVILVLGDSLSAAYGINQNAGWVALLQKRLTEQSYNYRVVNASISGATTRGGLSRLDQTLQTYKPAIIVLELGANDGLRGLTLQEMRGNLSAIIEQSRRNRAKVLLVGMRLPPNYGPAYTKKFHDIYVDLASRYRIPLVPFLLEGVATDFSLMQSDGLHPTAAAQPMMLENVWEEMRGMVRK
ncbi:MAG: arylesterase [Gammaproteobacteria bacterium]|nr:arylesterase [Gammaproteobacteria bacterium]